MDKSSTGRSAIASRLAFDDHEIMAICAKIDSVKIVDQVKKKIRKRRRYFEPEKIWIEYNRFLLSAIRDRIESFAYKHGHAIGDVPFQCDADCKKFIKDNGLQHAEQGGAYRLSDVVAWYNNRGFEPRGAHSLNLAKTLEDKLERKILG